MLELAGKKVDYRDAMSWDNSTAKTALELAGMVTLEGFMGRDARYMTGGWGSLSKLSIAVNKEERTEWINITAWDCDLSQFKKGCYVKVVGKLKVNEWTDKDTGEHRQNMEIVAEGFGATDRPEAKIPKCRIIERQENRYEENPGCTVFRNEGEVLNLVHDDEEVPADEEAATVLIPKKMASAQENLMKAIPKKAITRKKKD
jgi:hypothetical protein